jgi:hypothetical protein
MSDFRLLKLEDGSRCADPRAVHAALWRIRYGTPSKADQEHAYMAASNYLDLVERPSFGKKLPMIRRALRAASKETP